MVPSQQAAPMGRDCRANINDIRDSDLPVSCLAQTKILPFCVTIPLTCTCILRLDFSFGFYIFYYSCIFILDLSGLYILDLLGLYILDPFLYIFLGMYNCCTFKLICMYFGCFYVVR